MTARQDTEPQNLTLPSFVKKAASGWQVMVRVQPGAKKNELCTRPAGAEQTDGPEAALRIRLTAPAVDNKANKALTEFMADVLGIKKNKITLVSGEKSRNKTLLVSSDAQPDWQYLIKV